MKSGRPRVEENREELTHVGFKATPVTLDDIDFLVKRAKREGGVAVKSRVIRDAIHEVAERLRAGGK